MTRQPKARNAPPPQTTRPNGSGHDPHAQKHADFERLYQAHRQEVWARAYARCMNADAAWDIAQEAFLRLWQQWEEGEPILNPRAWLLRVAWNLAEDYGKSAFQRQGTRDPRDMGDLPSREPSPPEGWEREELRLKVRQALATFTEEERALLLMHHGQDMPYRRIEALTGQSKSAVGSRLQELRARMRRLLDPPYDAKTDPGLGPAS